MDRVNIAGNETIKGSSTITFNDRLPSLNANNRILRSYEYNSLLKQAYHDEKRLGMNVLSAFSDMEYVKKISNQKIYTTFKMSDYVISGVDCEVVVLPGDYELSAKNTLKLIFFELIGDKRFSGNIRNIVAVTAKKVNHG
jgi:hypothetical protein